MCVRVLIEYVTQPDPYHSCYSKLFERFIALALTGPLNGEGSQPLVYSYVCVRFPLTDWATYSIHCGLAK